MEGLTHCKHSRYGEEELTSAREAEEITLSVNAPVKALGSFLNVALSSLGRDKLFFQEDL
jgi:hypothetical protein